MDKKPSRMGSFVTIFLIYAIAIGAVYVIFRDIRIENTFIRVFLADLVATIVVFVGSVWFRNSSAYDPYWSVIPPLIAFYLIQIFPEGNDWRQLSILILVLFWSVRLTLNWARGWKGLSHEDWRYTHLAEKTGKWYWVVSFLGIHLIPTLFVFLGCLSLWYSLASTAPFNIWDAIAIVITLVAITVEWAADEQLRLFKKQNQTGDFIQTGLWGFSRHPNYLGEISFWFGLFLFVFSSQSSFAWWTAVGFLSMIFLFKVISIPMMEKRNRENKPGYQSYIKNVPALFPLKFKKKIS